MAARKMHGNTPVGKDIGNLADHSRGLSRGRDPVQERLSRRRQGEIAAPGRPFKGAGLADKRPRNDLPTACSPAEYGGGQAPAVKPSEHYLFVSRDLKTLSAEV